ncbi:MAG: hypothetical protein ACRC1U_01245 [Vibrionaceae bacterium]
MKLSTALVSSLSLIASLSVFAAAPGEEVSVGTVTATAKIEKICGFTIDKSNAEFTFGPNGMTNNAAKITATSNFDAYYGIKVAFAEDQFGKLGLKWVAKSNNGERFEFSPNSSEGFQQMNNSMKKRKLEIDVFPRLTNIKHEIEMDAGEFTSVATITMKCQEATI